MRFHHLTSSAHFLGPTHYLATLLLERFRLFPQCLKTGERDSSTLGSSINQRLLRSVASRKEKRQGVLTLITTTNIAHNEGANARAFTPPVATLRHRPAG